MYFFWYTPEVSGSGIRKEPKLDCRFYRTAFGAEPVRAWLKSLDPEVRREIGSDIQHVQWTWPVGMPLVDGFGRGLFEVRTNVNGNIYRVLFCLDGSTMVLLHAFAKKSQKTPKPDLDLARRRQKRRGGRQMKKHVGSTLSSLFEELHEKEELDLLTQKKLIAAKIERVMVRRKMTKSELAAAMHTSRTVVHRLLDPRDVGVTLATLWKASKALGVKLVQVA